MTYLVPEATFLPDLQAFSACCVVDGGELGMWHMLCVITSCRDVGLTKGGCGHELPHNIGQPKSVGWLAVLHVVTSYSVCYGVPVLRF